MNTLKFNKTIASWLALVGGPLGLHRFYLHGLGDWFGWLHPIPTALGLYGFERVKQYGIDDPLSWVLIPLFGFHFAHTALVAIVMGLQSREKWNAKYKLPEDSTSGQTEWLTIFAVVGALLLGTTVLMASLVYSFQRYFEMSIEAARVISQ
jgi:hypothetical protein